MITISGAAGKTGRALVRALVGRGEAVRALVRREAQGEALLALGACEYLVGDQMDPTAWRAALKGANAVYLICPNMHPDETDIVGMALTAAKAAGTSRLVYHSVLHPQVEAMPHHWAKLRAEELIFAGGLPFTILQPCAYMQNLLGYWESITRDGIYPVPYNLAARISLVDLDDVAEVAARALTEEGHCGAIYELAGPRALDQTEVAAELSRALGRTVLARELDREQWRENARKDGLDGYALETLLKMFMYYDRYGLIGNPRVCGWLLGRSPRDLRDYLGSVRTERRE
ncbi:MAG: NmrA family NAD(P)-binding protein [Anaerolineae bacterium]|nr:NmrA family NAD(P)-binding protein [Anaerolineae bacterium]